METVPREHTFSTQLSRLVQGSMVLAGLYSLLAGMANHAAHVLAGAKGTYPVAVPIFESSRGIEFTCSFRFHDLEELSTCVGQDLCCLALACALKLGLTFALVYLACSTDWVEEKVQIEECWEKVSWKNPWTWVKSLVCSITEIVKWVLQVVCKIKKPFFLIAGIACLILFAGAVMATGSVGPEEDPDGGIIGGSFGGGSCLSRDDGEADAARRAIGSEALSGSPLVAPSHSQGGTRSDAMRDPA